MQALEIQISKKGKAGDHMRLGVDNWSGDKNDLKVRSGKAGKYKELLQWLDDPDALAARNPIKSRVMGGGDAKAGIKSGLQ